MIKRSYILNWTAGQSKLFPLKSYYLRRIDSSQMCTGLDSVLSDTLVCLIWTHHRVGIAQKSLKLWFPFRKTHVKCCSLGPSVPKARNLVAWDFTIINDTQDLSRRDRSPLRFPCSPSYVCVCWSQTRW